MKKLFLIPLAFAALASCSQHEVVDNGATTGETVTSYLAVNLVASNGGTRANDPEGYEADFETGTGAENAVDKVRFYFFDASGNAVQIYANDAKNYYDVAMSGSNDDMNNVEKILEATLVLNTKTVEGYDDSNKGEGEVTTGIASVIAVVNPEAITSAFTSDLMSIEALEGVFANLNPSSTNSKFVMSSSVYSNGGEKPAMAVDVTNNIFPSAGAAKLNPVTIFVERVMAKVRVTVDESMSPVKTDNDGVVYALSDDDEQKAPAGSDGEVAEEEIPIYVKVLGWNVTATTSKSRLMKSINTQWSEELFASKSSGNWQPWNDAAWYRSYWAINPPSDQYEYEYGKFGTINKSEGPEEGDGDLTFELTDAGAIKYFDSESDHVNYVYVQENAALTDDGKEWSDVDVKETAKTADNTKVIVAAQLVDENGKPLEFAEYGFDRYTVDGVKAILASQANLYDEDGTPLSAEDIEFKTVWSVEKGTSDVDHSVAGRYSVYAQLSETAALKTWYKNADVESETHEQDVVEDPNEVLQSLGKVKVWKNGYTYYTVKIAHIAGVLDDNTDGTAGKYGVVRNHVYAVNIKSINGLGTPVFDPEEEIIPEDPEDVYSFCAAEIRVLSWRVVSQDVDLTW